MFMHTYTLVAQTAFVCRRDNYTVCLSFAARHAVGALHQEGAVGGYVRHRRPHGCQQLQLS